jgi:hypothetical protein
MTTCNLPVNSQPTTLERREVRPPAFQKSRHRPCNGLPARHFHCVSRSLGTTFLDSVKLRHLRQICSMRSLLETPMIRRQHCRSGRNGAAW